jgi:hypothetical protein
MTKLDQPKEYTTSRNGGENNTWKGDAKTTCNVYGKINGRTVTSKTRDEEYQLQKDSCHEIAMFHS